MSLVSAGSDRDLQRNGAGDAGDDRVGLERSPAEHHLVAFGAGDLHQLLAQRHGSAPGNHVGRVDVDMFGERDDQGSGAVVRVAVDAGGVGAHRVENGGSDRRQGGEGQLVGGQFDRAGDRPARGVGR